MNEVKGSIERVQTVGKSALAKLSPLLFFLGIIIALVVGLLIGAQVIDITQDHWGYISAILAILGFVIGLATAIGVGTISKRETTHFLVAGSALVITGIGGEFVGEATPIFGDYLYGVGLCMILFFAPAIVIIALRALWDIGKK